MNKSIVPIIISTLLLLHSCMGFFEENLDNGTYAVQLQSPNDSLVSNSFAITFLWEKMKEAKRFRLQVVHPSFEHMEYMVVDTFITDNSFTYTFTEKGEYAWRVRAENNTSETPYSSRMFSIDKTVNLAEQVLLIVSPKADFATNAYSLDFKWVSLPAADDYLFSVQKENAQGEYIVEPVLLTSTKYTLDNGTINFAEGTYFWSVQARNSLPSKTPEVTRTFMIDRTSPGTPGAVFPAKDTIMKIKTIAFTWERYDDGTGSPVFDTVYVLKKNISGTFDIYRKVKQSSIVTETTITNLVSGEYQWHVQSFDMAGNKSQKSGNETFSIE